MTPKTGRRVHLSLMVFWASNLIWFWFLPHAWRIPYLAVTAIYSIVVGHWSAHAAERPSEVVAP